MSVILVRRESEVPNILNADDIMGFRFATGGINGVVKDYLNELSYEISGRNFKIHSGEAILDGWQVKIDASGATISANNTVNREYYTVYLEIDLSVPNDKKATIKATVDTVTYPVINSGDDISLLHSGVARMELYRFICQNSVISSVERLFTLLDGTNEKSLYSNESGNAEKVNNIELIKDANGLLRIGDIVIPQRKLLWQGELNLSSSPMNFQTIFTNTYSLLDKTLEVELRPASASTSRLNYGPPSFLKMKFHSGYNFTASQNYITFVLGTYRTNAHNTEPSYLFHYFIQFNCMGNSISARAWGETDKDTSTYYANVSIIGVYEILE